MQFLSINLYPYIYRLDEKQTGNVFFNISAEQLIFLQFNQFCIFKTFMRH